MEQEINISVIIADIESEINVNTIIGCLQKKSSPPKTENELLPQTGSQIRECILHIIYINTNALQMLVRSNGNGCSIVSK